MLEIKIGGMIYTFEDDWKVIEWMDANANALNEQPAIDAAPVVHGRWEDACDGAGAVCSVCRCDFCTIIYPTENFNYCPNCGARMRGGEGHGL